MSNNLKEEFKKKWDEYPINWISDDAMKEDAFRFFWQEIEARENTILITQGALQYQRERTKYQESIIQAADGVAEALSRWQTFDARIHTGMNAAEFHLRSVAALEKYKSLKENSNGKI